MRLDRPVAMPVLVSRGTKPQHVIAVPASMLSPGGNQLPLLKSITI
jgi:hypothetical protein